MRRVRYLARVGPGARRDHGGTLLVVLLTLVALARAACPPGPVDPTDADQARAQVAAGDLAWVEGDRGAAACAWRTASRAADPAAAAMAHLRRLRTSGNLGLAVHGPRADRALARCPVDEAWCRLARADRDLLVSELGLADRRAEALVRATELADDLPAAAAVRAMWAGAPLGEVAVPPGDDDPWGPVGRALAARDGAMPTGPGTWLLGLGVIGATGLGAGPLVRFSHPDLGWQGWQLDAEAWLTTAAAGRGRVGLRSAGRWWVLADLAGGQLPVPLYDAGGELLLDTGRVIELQARVAPGSTLGPLAAWVGPVLRADLPAGDESWTPGHGLFGGVAAGARRTRAVLSGEAALTGPDHLALTADLRSTTPLLGGAGAGRLVGTSAPLASSPLWRRPAWGGGSVLRSAPLGRLREPWMAGAVAEWRRALVGPLGLTLFTEGAWADGPHAGGGGGLRLYLPPQPSNTVRLDVAAGDLGWALSAGWGEAF